MAECDEAVSEMRAMAEREHELGSQGIKQRNALPFSIECARDERCRAAYYDQSHQLHLEIGKHFDERNRIHKELRKLEKTCRTAAQASEQLAVKAMRELKDAYDQAKRAYDQAKAIYERIKNGSSEAYEKRNDAHSDALELAMDKAKQRILDVPKSEIIGAIQDASFDQLKSQIQQLNGDMAALESAIQSVGAEAQPTVVPLSRGRNSGSAMFQEAINQAEQDARDPSARKARERLAQEQRAAAKAQEDQSSRGTWKVIGMLGNAVLAAAEGQNSTERMQLALNSLAQPAEEPDTSGLPAEDDNYTSSSDATQGTVCEAERQGVVSANKNSSSGNGHIDMGHYTDEGLSIPKMVAHVTEEVRSGGDFRYVECGSRCNKFEPGSPNYRGGVEPGSPDYRDALLLWADLQDTRIKKKVGRGTLDFAFYRFRGCIARYMAAQNIAP